MPQINYQEGSTRFLVKDPAARGGCDWRISPNPDDECWARAFFVTGKYQPLVVEIWSENPNPQLVTNMKRNFSAPGTQIYEVEAATELMTSFDPVAIGMLYAFPDVQTPS